MNVLAKVFSIHEKITATFINYQKIYIKFAFYMRMIFFNQKHD